MGTFCIVAATPWLRTVSVKAHRSGLWQAQALRMLELAHSPGCWIGGLPCAKRILLAYDEPARPAGNRSCSVARNWPSGRMPSSSWVGVLPLIWGWSIPRRCRRQRCHGSVSALPYAGHAGRRVRRLHEAGHQASGTLHHGRYRGWGSPNGLREYKT